MRSGRNRHEQTQEGRHPVEVTKRGATNWLWIFRNSGRHQIFCRALAALGVALLIIGDFLPFGQATYSGALDSGRHTSRDEPTFRREEIAAPPSTIARLKEQAEPARSEFLCMNPYGRIDKEALYGGKFAGSEPVISAVRLERACASLIESPNRCPVCASALAVPPAVRFFRIR